MPAHILHNIFGEEVLQSAIDELNDRCIKDGTVAELESILKDYGNLFRFASQGPDFFYHNQRTRPSGLKYGALIHRKDFGRLIANMVRVSRTNSESVDMKTLVYILGFTTHAFIDRNTHPYIIYFSGWVDRERKETRKYYRCHAFLERILDVLLLKKKLDVDIKNYRFLSTVDCGEQLPYEVIKTLVRALHITYPDSLYKSRDRKRIENAYSDTIFFYRLTNHLNTQRFSRAYNFDRQDGFKRRRIALIHPHKVPDNIDFLNTEKRKWVHPCDESMESDLSFIELYELAIRKAVPAILSVYRALRGRISTDQIDVVIGNESLDTGMKDSMKCKPQFSSPFPLADVIDSIYHTISKGA